MARSKITAFALLPQGPTLLAASRDHTAWSLAALPPEGSLLEPAYLMSDSLRGASGAHTREV